MSDSARDEESSGGFWRKLKSGLGKTRGRLAEGVGNLLLGEKEIDEEVLDELETSLLLTDVGVDATREIMDTLRSRVRRKELNKTGALYEALAVLLYFSLASTASARPPQLASLPSICSRKAGR
jgi:fused signal recognition particle receptor